jgi:hypothetical protein
MYLQFRYVISTTYIEICTIKHALDTQIALYRVIGLVLRHSRVIIFHDYMTFY